MLFSDCLEGARRRPALAKPRRKPCQPESRACPELAEGDLLLGCAVAEGTRVQILHLPTVESVPRSAQQLPAQRSTLDAGRRTGGSAGSHAVRPGAGRVGMQALLVGPQAAQNLCLRGTASSVRAWLLVLVFKFEQPSSCGGNVGVAVLWRRHFHRSLPIPNGYGGEVSLQL